MAFFKSLVSQVKYPIYDKANNQMCATEQESLVFIDIDTLTVNETALQQLGLLESQVLFRCYNTQFLLHSCLSEKFKMGAPQWKKTFNTFFAQNNQFIMTFWIVQ